MNPSQEKDLIAYHLHELSPRREFELRRELEHDPELLAVSESVVATLGAFSKAPTPAVDEAVVERLWHALRPSLPVHSLRPSSLPRWRLPVLVGMGVLAAATLLYFFTPRTQLRQQAPSASTGQIIATKSLPVTMEPTMNCLASSTVRRPSLTLIASAGLLASHLSAQPAQQLPLTMPGQTATLMAEELVPFSNVGLKSNLPEVPSSVVPQPVHNKPRTETSISLGTAAQLTATRLPSPNFGLYYVQSLDPSATVVGSFRQSFRPLLGYSVNMGYTRTTEHNVYTAPYSQTRFDIPYNVYELSVAYLMQKHLSPKLSGFTTFGGGALDFLPVHRGADAATYVPNNKGTSAIPANLVRPMAVAGLGVDYRLTKHLGVRAEYRGLLYKYPDDHGIVPREITVSSEPTLSLSYTFGSKRD